MITGSTMSVPNRQLTRRSKPPFAKAHELNSELDGVDSQQPITLDLPGHPRVKLDDIITLSDFLETEFCSEDLENIASKLWLMSVQSSSNISALHRQRVKDRKIVVTEDPKLHLVWRAGHIYIKPLPVYLTSYQFWETFLLGDGLPKAKQEAIRRAALGYLRTYIYLIRHESDFEIALEQKLIPNITWKAFCRFSSLLHSVQDDEVNQRYTYGELRLTRLNFYTKIFLRKWHFQRMHSQYGAYFSRFYGPLLFVFGVCSVVLNACQLVVTVDGASNGTTLPWRNFSQMSRLISAIMLLLTACIIVLLLSLFTFRFTLEWAHAIKNHFELSRVKRFNHFGKTAV